VRPRARIEGRRGPVRKRNHPASVLIAKFVALFGKVGTNFAI
jgi:hypothetical protein